MRIITSGEMIAERLYLRVSERSRFGFGRSVPVTRYGEDEVRLGEVWVRFRNTR